MTDPLQASALNALEPFLALAPSATSPRAAADLVSQALAAPNTYVFAELLQAPNIVALQTAAAPHNQWHRALELFCWGTYDEYTTLLSSTPAAVPTLSEAQADKLRLLTLLTLAHTPTELAYPRLQTHLQLADTAALEALLTTALTQNLVSGRLNPTAQCLEASSIAPLRDLRPGAAAGLAASLAAWERRTAAVLAEVEERAAAVRARAAARGRSDARWDALMEKHLASGPRDDEGKKRDREGEAGVAGDAKRGGKFAAAGRRVGALLS